MGQKEGFKTVASEALQYQTQEMLLVENAKHKITLGLPKEQEHLEKRVALRPEAVGLLVDAGFEVHVESGAGHSSKYKDSEYADRGAMITYSPDEVFDKDIVLKIAPPTIQEVALMKKGKMIISAIQSNTLNSQVLEKLCEKGITAVAFEMIQDKAGGLPLVRAMSEIAGSTVMLIAAEYLSSVHDGKGIILGGVTGVPPTSVVILGAGTVAEFAARTAVGLGAEVKIFDNHVYRLRRIKERLGQAYLFTSTIDSVMLEEALESADVAIGALRSENNVSQSIVTEEVVSRMKTGSVIIDVSIDNGGCFETSEVTTLGKPIFRKHGVIHCCLPNIPSRVARTASTAFSNILSPILMRMIRLGSAEKLVFEGGWFAKGVYTYKGGITNQSMADKFQMKYKDLRLIIAAHL